LDWAFLEVQEDIYSADALMGMHDREAVLASAFAAIQEAQAL
jgi:hypothetical protein